MFTGLVETVGTVASVDRRAGAVRLSVESDLGPDAIRPGDSVAVDGVCLTVAAVAGRRASFDAVLETLSRTTLRSVHPGRRVNLERALRLGDRLGGHLVQGHVDGTARVLRVGRRPDDWRVRLALPRALARYVALKGSVAIHGVSLTVSGASAESFEVALVPETIRRTTLGALAPGDEVNVEVDLLARYLERLVAQDPPTVGVGGGTRRPARGAGVRFGGK